MPGGDACFAWLSATVNSQRTAKRPRGQGAKRPTRRPRLPSGAGRHQRVRAGRHRRASAGQGRHRQHPCARPREPSAAVELLAALQATHGRATLRINNAGVAVGGTFDQVDATGFDWLVSINFGAVVRLTRAFMPLLQAAPAAQVVNISSLFGLIAPPGQTAYCAPRAGSEHGHGAGCGAASGGGSDRQRRIARTGPSQTSVPAVSTASRCPPGAPPSCRLQSSRRG